MRTLDFEESSVVAPLRFDGTQIQRKDAKAQRRKDSWKFEVAPAAVGFINSRALGPQYQGDMIVGAARPFLEGGHLFRLTLSGSRRQVSVNDPRLEDRVADNLGKFEITESESLHFADQQSRASRPRHRKLVTSKPVASSIACAADGEHDRNFHQNSDDCGQSGAGARTKESDGDGNRESEDLGNLADAEFSSPQGNQHPDAVFVRQCLRDVHELAHNRS